jgi:staphylococcal nuclease domain-containing protein 1
VVTYVTDEMKVYVQYSEQGPKVDQSQSELREIFSQTKPVGGHTPKKGELLAARFTADNEWYRARVEKIEGNNRISVYFIDYGNREVITDLSRLTTLPPGTFAYLTVHLDVVLFAFSRLHTASGTSS